MLTEKQYNVCTGCGSEEIVGRIYLWKTMYGKDHQWSMPYELYIMYSKKLTDESFPETCGEV